MDLLYFAISLQNELSEEKFGLVPNFPTTPNTPNSIPFVKEMYKLINKFYIASLWSLDKLKKNATDTLQKLRKSCDLFHGTLETFLCNGIDSGPLCTVLDSACSSTKETADYSFRLFSCLCLCPSCSCPCSSSSVFCMVTLIFLA